MATEQARIDDEEWAKPINWRAGRLGIYASRRDSRTFVPKRRGIGLTINFGNSKGIVAAVLTLTVITYVFVHK